MNLFVYGTLMCEDIMEEVSGYRLHQMHGILKNYRRRAVKGELFPGIFPHEGDQVQGILYLNPPEAAWNRLDRFEGEMYTRQQVRVETADGKTVPATTYVVKPAFITQLDEAEWDFNRLLSYGKIRFQKKIQRIPFTHRGRKRH